VTTGTPLATASSTFIFGPLVAGHGNASTAARRNTSLVCATSPTTSMP
jgi:hypothetical protein